MSDDSIESPRAGALSGLGRRLLVPAVLALVVLVAMALVTDSRELAHALGRLPGAVLPPVLALSLVNYGLRFARWELYLRRLGVRLATLDSLGVFLVGFALSITPGKAGELGKAWLARELGGGKARRTVAVVLAERITDLAGVLVLTAVGALAFPHGPAIAVVCLSMVTILFALLLWRRAARRILALAGRLPLVRGFSGVLSEVYDGFRELFAAGPLTVAMALSVLAWGAEGLGFVLIARVYAEDFAVSAGVFSYAASTLAGAVSLLPGGLMASEAALTALLGGQGLDTAAAASATLWIRAATLWFAVALGLCALPWVLRRLRRERRDAQGSGGG